MPRESVLLAAGDESPEEAAVAAAVPPAKAARLDALDAFRGLTIFGMLLVNNIALGWHTPAELIHARWNEGVHFADLVFPWFLLIGGVAIPFSWASHWKKGWSRGRFMGRAAVRAVVLVALGCLIDSSAARRPIFDLDVLQLIGLSYFVAAFLTMLLPSLPRVILASLFLMAHAAVIQHVHVPGMPTGTFESGRNVIAYVNTHVLARYHLAGLISVVPASALVLFGTFFGDTLRRERFSPIKRLWIVLGWGAAMAVVGAIWNRWLPYNKPVWTGSYILFCGGIGALILGAFYGALDVFPGLRGIKPLVMPLRVFGANAITAYVAPILIKLNVLRIYDWPHTRVPMLTWLLYEAHHRWGPINGGWVYTLGYIGVCWIILLVLYWRKIWIRV